MIIVGSITKALSVLSFIKQKHPMAVSSIELYKFLYGEPKNGYGRYESKLIVRFMSHFVKSGYVYKYKHRKFLCYKLTPEGSELLGVPYIVSEPEVKDGSTSRQ